MSVSERWNRLEAVFGQALDLPPDERRSFVERTCADEPDLADEILELLGIADHAGDELRTLVASEVEQLAGTETRGLIGRRLGAYQLVSHLGSGGMGSVYLAERDDAQFRRTVAVKVLHRGLGSTEAAARFREERQILASLDHPGIVRLLDGGTEDGLLYLVMERIEGQTITHHAREHSLSIRARVELILETCAALEYAHRQLVVHRDIKPSNVLVDGDGRTKLVDFGIAKLLDADTEREVNTLTGAALLTVQYASPEQMRGESVSTASDVYSVGAVLYELLAERPHRELEGSTLAMLRAADSVAPVKPSLVAPLEHRRELAGDLDNIVLKALAHEPERRYGAVERLADDLRRYLAGLPVAARPPTLRYRAGKWLGRNRVLAASSSAALITLAAVGITSFIRIQRAQHALGETVDKLSHKRAELETRNDELVLLQAQALVERDATRALAWVKQIRSSAPVWGAARTVVVDAINLGFARHVWRVGGTQIQPAFSPDGRWVVSSGSNPSLLVADLRTGHTHELSLSDVPVASIAFLADGRLIAAADDDSIMEISPSALEGNGGAPRMVQAGSRGATVDRTYIAATADGRWLAVTHYESSTVTLIDLQSGAKTTFAGSREGARAIAFSADGTLVATASVDRVIRIWDVATGAKRELQGDDVASHLVFSPDGQHVLASELAGIREWTLADGHGRVLPLPAQRYNGVAISHDGKTVAAGTVEGPIVLFDRASAQVTTLRGHNAFVMSVAFSADGALLASAGVDRTVRVWQLPRFRGRMLGRATGVRSPAVSPDGHEVAAGAADGSILRIPRAGGPSTTLTGHSGEVFDVVYSPDGHVLATQSKDQTVRLWDLAAGTSRVVAKTAPWVSFGRLQFSRDGRLLAVTLDLDTLAVLDITTGARVCTFGGTGFNLAHAFAPDGRSIAFTWNQEVRIGDLGTCESRVVYSHAFATSAYMLAFTSDGRYLASASDDATIGLYDVQQRTTRRLVGHDQYVNVIAFTPDGRSLVSASADRTIRIWNVQTGEARILRGHETPILALRLSPDGRVIASIGHDTKIRIWDVATGAVGVLIGNEAQVSGLAFSPDSRDLISSGQDGTIRAWPADPLSGVPIAPAELKLRLDELTTAQIDREGQATTP